MQEGASVFAYWDGDDHSPLGPFKTEWMAEFPQFRIFGNSEVSELMKRYFPSQLDLLNDLQIPAAKADVARLLLLFEIGGLYVDCHCGIRDAAEIRRSLARRKPIFVDRMRTPPRPQEQRILINGMIFCPARSDLTLAICRQALINLAEQRERERTRICPYDIWRLTGAGLLTPLVLKSGAEVAIIPEEDAPVVRNRHKGYSVKGQHWSERQKVERLFTILPQPSS